LTLVKVISDPWLGGRDARCEKPGDRNDGEAGPGEKRHLGADGVPQGSSDDARGQQGQPRHEVEHAERGSPKLGRDGVGHQRSQQSLAEAHVQAPEDDAEQESGNP
jgi:hypothetical protein